MQRQLYKAGPEGEILKKWFQEEMSLITSCSKERVFWIVCLPCCQIVYMTINPESTVLIFAQ